METQKLKEKAEKLFSRGKWPKALSAYLRLSELKPTDLRIRQKIGETLLRLGRTQEAQIIFRQIADLYMEDGQLHKAISVNHRLLELNREDREVQTKLATLYERQGTASLRDLPMEPDEVEKKVHEVCQGSEGVLLEINELEKRFENSRIRSDWKGALEEAVKLWQLEPGNIERRILIGLVLFHMDRKKEAFEIYLSVARQFLRKSQPLRALFMQAQIDWEPLKERKQEITKCLAIIYGRIWEQSQNGGSPTKKANPLQRFRARREIMEEMLQEVMINPIEVGKIRPIPILSQLPRDACEAFIEKLTPIFYRSGEKIFLPGEEADFFGLISHGNVQLHLPEDGSKETNDQNVQERKEGEMLGTFTFLYQGQRVHEAIAQGEVEFLQLQKKDFEKLLKDHQPIREAFDDLYAKEVLPALLKSHAIFQQCSIDTLKQISKKFNSERHEKNFILKEGQNCHSLYFLQKGMIEVYCGELFQEKPMMILKGGSFFGEWEWITGTVFPHTFKSSGPITLFTLRKSALGEELQKELEQKELIVSLMQNKSLTKDVPIESLASEFGLS